MLELLLKTNISNDDDLFPLQDHDVRTRGACAVTYKTRLQAGANMVKSRTVSASSPIMQERSSGTLRDGDQWSFTLQGA